MTVTPADSNPNMEDDGGRSSHWRCTISYGKRRMTMIFTMGAGHCGREPELAEVLSCLFLDASGYDNANGFEDWCSEYGYDTDSRKAERTYRAVERQAKQLRSILGDDYAKLWAQYANA